MVDREEDLLAGVYDDSEGFLFSPGSAVLEKILREENSGLKRQLDSARGIIKVVERRVVNADGTSGTVKRLRLGDGGGAGGGGGSSSALTSGGSSTGSSSGSEEASSVHPDTIRADRAAAELEESRVLREQDKLQYEVKIREAEQEKGKLLRQVKFLSQEEEEARAGFENKKAVFLEEISRLQGTVSKERAALAAARAEEGRGGELERQRYERKLRREEEARRVAEEKTESLQETAKTGADEVTHLRKRRRELEAKNAELTLEVAALRRRQGEAPPTTTTATTATAGGAKDTPSVSAWDTPVARELRTKIKSLEREARKRESVVQGLENDRRNAIALEDKVATLSAALQRAEDRLKAAAAVETDTAAIRAEKEEWSLVFARALKEDQTAASFKVQLKGLKAKEGQGGERGLRPTPLTALRLLREAQEERSLSVKELTAIRLRYDNNHKRLAQAELALKHEKDRGESIHDRAEELEAKVETLERRCRSAEQEIRAQKELIESYEKDNFRKPAGEGWLSDHASLQSALSAAKDEAESLRKAAEEQVSALEAGRLKDRAARAEAALKDAVAARDRSTKAAEQYAETLALMEKEAANGAGLRVLHSKDNPLALEAEAAKRETKRQLQVLTEENKRLTQQLESVGTGGMDASMFDGGVSMLGGGPGGTKGGDTPDAEKFSLRLTEMYKQRSKYFRECVYLLTGYRIDLMKGPSPQKFRLRSMYAERESDCLVFQEKEQSQGGGLELVETPFAVEHTDKINGFLRDADSFPAFLSSLTLELFEKQTLMPR